jgi:chromosome segregation ATPase
MMKTTKATPPTMSEQLAAAIAVSDALEAENTRLTERVAEYREANVKLERNGREWKDCADALESASHRQRHRIEDLAQEAAFWQGVAMGIDAGKARAAIENKCLLMASEPGGVDNQYIDRLYRQKA